jgi:hypothetical protein
LTLPQKIRDKKNSIVLGKWLLVPGRPQYLLIDR